MSILENAPLGKRSTYIDQYDASLLFPIPRKGKRDEIAVPDALPFFGVDIWNAFELSWLNEKGKPEVAVAEVRIACHSINIVESKSFKLYLNSFNHSVFSSGAEVAAHIEQDISATVKGDVAVTLYSVDDSAALQVGKSKGVCLDGLDVICTEYLVNPKLLQLDKGVIHETLYTNLLKSNCLVTGQPDWGSIWIEYEGVKLNHANLLRYIVSLRNHNEFHEQCVERVFMDIMRECHPEKLTVYARYTRRGGVDINPFRTNKVAWSVVNQRLVRQ